MKTNKILLVDDEIALRFLLAETLVDEGFDIIEAADGQEAIENLKSEEYDLIILDYVMPVKTGLEVCHWLRGTENANKQKPVILLTAKSMDKDKEQALSAGATAFMIKPFSPMQLLAKMRSLL